MRALVRLIAACGVVLMTAGAVNATTLAELSTEQMTDASDAIVRGTVVAVRTAQDDNGRWWTLADVQVERTLKGGLVVGQTVTVESLGGITPVGIVDVKSVPRFSVGEEALLFLYATPRGRYGTVGMVQGKYTVRQNPTDGSEMVVRYATPYSQPYDARFIPHPAADQRVSLDHFEDQILDRVESGWDGQSIPGVSDEHLRQINRVAPNHAPEVQ